MTRRPDLPVARGERLLAWATAPDGSAVGGTRDALYLSARTPPRLPWEEIATAEWDPEGDLLRVVEVGTFGERRPEHRLALERPERLLTLVRERVMASIVLQRHVEVRGALGVRVIGRRAPGGSTAVSWFVEYDVGLEPTDPEVAATVDEALAVARADVGE